MEFLEKGTSETHGAFIMVKTKTACQTALSQAFFTMPSVWCVLDE